MKHLGIAAAIAVIAAAAWALAPRTADAQGGGMIVAKFVSIPYCPAPGQTVVGGAHYFAGIANTVTILPVENRGWSCSRHTVLTAGRHAQQRGDWSLSLQSEPGSDGAALTGGEIALPPTFSGARGQSGLTVRDNENDGAWPAWQGRYNHGVVAFTVPSTHTGTVYLHVSVDYTDAAGGESTEQVSFSFEPPVAPIYATEPAPDSECPVVLDRSSYLLLPSQGDGDPNHLYRERNLLDCGGSTRWTLRQYMAIAPLPGFRIEYTGPCDDVKTITFAPYETMVDSNGRTLYHWRHGGTRYCDGVWGSPYFGVEYWNTCEAAHTVTVAILDRRLMPRTATTVAYRVRATRTYTCHSDRGASDHTNSEEYWTTQIPATVTPASS